MNAKNLVYWLELIIFSILIAFVLPIIFEWIETRSLIITTNGIKDALFFGILVPFVVFLSKHMKNDFFKVFVALITIFSILLFLQVGFLFN